jgi:hypothetical protein
LQATEAYKRCISFVIMSNKVPVMSPILLVSLLVLLLATLIEGMDLVVEGGWEVNERQSQSVLKFSLHTQRDSQSGRTLMQSSESKVPIDLCLLLDAAPCYCVSHWPSNVLHVVESGLVISSFNMILPAICIPPASDGLLHSVAVEMMVMSSSASGETRGAIDSDSRTEISAPHYITTTSTAVGEVHDNNGGINDAPSARQLDMLTLVLPLTAKDIRRSQVLLRTLTGIPRDTVHELLLYCPDDQVDDVLSSLQSFFAEEALQAAGLAFPIRILPESSLFTAAAASGAATGSTVPKGVDTYGLQMSLKLLAARRVQTAFYMTLDADLVLLKPHLLSEMLLAASSSSSSRGSGSGSRARARMRNRAAYEDESRAVHPAWWEGSARLLGVHNEAVAAAADSTAGSGFGVTPSILSTFGSLVVVREVLAGVAACGLATTPSGGDDGRARREGWRFRDIVSAQTTAAREVLWLSSFAKTNVLSGSSDSSNPSPRSDGDGDGDGDGDACYSPGQVVLWSEYTLYRLALDITGLFGTLHSEAIQPREAEVEARIRAGEVPEGKEGVVDLDPTGVVDITPSSSLPPALHCFDVWYRGDLPWRMDLALAPLTRCLFSVVQSSAEVDPGSIERALFAQ